MKMDIYYKFLQKQWKIGQPYFLKLFKEWELKGLAQGTLKHCLNPLKENNKIEEHYKLYE